MRVRAIITNAENDKVLLGKDQKNKFILPGGHIQDDEHPVDALLREVWEETGIEDYDMLEYLWPMHDNYVFLFTPKDTLKYPTNVNDPCREFSILEWFSFAALQSADLDSYSEDILYRFLKECVKDHETVSGGYIEVLVDGESVYKLDDDAIWQTLPKLAQEQSKGKKVEFRQVLDDGTVLDQSLDVMPKAMAGIQENTVESLIDELLSKYIPEEKSRPLVEVIDNVDFLAKTTYKIENGEAVTKIQVRKDISENTSVLRQVLAHEIIHHHLYQKFGKKVAKHGEHFNWYASKINGKEGDNFVTQFADNTEFKY